MIIKALTKVDFEYKLLVAGSGDESYVASLKKLSVDCGINKNIEWVGWKDNDAKFEFLAEVDLFALTSHSENFAIVIIESLSVGTPVLISNNIGLYSYVEDNDFGWVTNLNTADIANKLNLIYKQNDKLQSIMLNAPATVREDYEDLQIAEQYLTLYKRVIAEK